MVIKWWRLGIPVAHGQLERWRPLLGQRMYQAGVNYGSFIGERDQRRYHLAPDAKCDFIEYVPIPRPRGKTVEYRYGRWERYTKAKGWQPA